MKKTNSAYQPNPADFACGKTADFCVIGKMVKLQARKNNRLKNHNYSDNGYYFIIVCSKDRKNIFGEYKNINDVGAGLASARDNINLSKLGQIIDNQLNDIPN